LLQFTFMALPEPAPGPDGFELEPSAEEKREMGETVLSYLISFYEGLPDAPASNHEGGLHVARRFRGSPPELGNSDFRAVLSEVAEAAAVAAETAGPGYLAYIPGGGMYSASLADFIATSVNRFVNVWHIAPAFAQIEATVIRWFADLFALPSEAGGILTSGGSLANFSAIVTARRTRVPDDFLHGTLYASEQTHASVAKAAVLAGFPRGNVRAVPTDPALRIDPSALLSMLRADRERGFQPFLLVANAGTTNTGAVDPISDLARLSAREGLWLHVDGAYGGFFQLTERGRRAFDGIEAADSITLDPHKGMFLPYGTGCLLVRDRRLLRLAHHVEAEYLQDLAPEEEIPNFSEYSPELSRDFRGLRVWLPVQLHGLARFRSALDEKLDLARLLHEGLGRTPGFEVPWEPELTVVAFRYRPAGGGEEQTDAFNRTLLERIIASKRVFLSSTLVRGRFIIRACIVSHRTHRDRVEEALEIIRRSAAELDG
jgi:aromatic-L-amino-acid decarboxylase